MRAARITTPIAWLVSALLALSAPACRDAGQSEGSSSRPGGGGEVAKETTRALMLVASNVTDEDRVDEFNEWYDRHVQELLQLEGIVSATRWEVSEHELIPGLDSIDGRRFLALYEIECDDLEAMRDRIDRTSGDRSHSETLELDPLPVTLLFEHRSSWGGRSRPEAP
jgi:hypothetical protein